VHGQLAQHRSLRSPRTIHVLPGEHGEIARRLEVAPGGWGKVVCWSAKTSIISETRKDRGKITIEDL